jgi:hypothetical protein
LLLEALGCLAPHTGNGWTIKVVLWADALALAHLVLWRLVHSDQDTATRLLVTLKVLDVFGYLVPTPYVEVPNAEISAHGFLQGLAQREK